SLYGLGQGNANARITVVRGGGAVGRCEVDVNISPVYYTNLYETNYLITNIGPIITNIIDIAALGLPDFFTNFPCPPPPYIFPPTSVSNNGVITVSAT